MNRLTPTCVYSIMLCVFTLISANGFANTSRSLVEDKHGNNVSLLVGVSHGLPGIDIDVSNMRDIASHSAFKFQSDTLEDEEGTSANVLSELSRLSTDAGHDGTLMLYYSGHGDVGSLYLQDGDQKIQGIRQAIESSRQNLGPLNRLVLIIDACFSGSLLDPMRINTLGRIADPQLRAMLFADSVFDELNDTNLRDEASNYWKKLFVFASSRADETSLAGSDGSVFTNAFLKAFNETETEGGTMGDLVRKTQTYTEGHHPVARFAPNSLEYEKLIR